MEIVSLEGLCILDANWRSYAKDAKPVSGAESVLGERLLVDEPSLTALDSATAHNLVIVCSFARCEDVAESLGRALKRPQLSWVDRNRVHLVRKPFELKELQRQVAHLAGCAGSYKCSECFQSSLQRFQTRSQVQRSYCAEAEWRFVVVDDQPEEARRTVLEALAAVGVKAAVESIAVADAKNFVAGKRGTALGHAAAAGDADGFLVDLHMPEDRGPHPTTVESNALGLAVIRALRRSGTRAPIIAMTMFEDTSSVIRSVGGGADWHVPKSRALSLGPILMDLLTFGVQGVPVSSAGGEDGSPPRIVDLTATLQGKERQEERQLLRRLFAKSQRIEVLREASAGRSGSRVLFVRPWRLLEGAVDSAHPEAVKVVKIGKSVDLRQEVRQFEEFIDSQIDNYVGRPKNPIAEEAGRAAVAYSAVGVRGDYESPGNYPITLGEMLHRTGWKALRESGPDEVFGTGAARAVLEQLRHNILDALHRSGAMVEEAPVVSEYRWILPDDLQGVIDSKRVGVKEVDCGSDRELTLLLEEPPEAVVLKGATVLERSSDELKLVVPVTPGGTWRGGFRLKVGASWAEPGPYATDPRLERRGKALTVGIGKIQSKYSRLAAIATETMRVVLGMEQPVDDSKSLVLPAASEEHEVQTIRNPLAFLRELEERQTRIRMSFSHIHGDLNLENVLITRSPGGERRDPDLGYRCWVVDFAKTRLGHAAFDFAKLEIELKTHVFSELLTESVLQWVAAEGISQKAAFRAVLGVHHQHEAGRTGAGFGRTSHAPTPPGGKTSSPTMEAMARGVYERAWAPVKDFVDGLRQTAMRERGLSPQEYFVSVFLYSCAALKFKNLATLPKSGRDLPVPRLIAFLTASGAAERLEHMGLEEGRPARP